MFTAEELRENIDKFIQKAAELLQQEDWDGARIFQKQVKILQKQLALTGGDVLQLNVPCCLCMLSVPQPRHTCTRDAVEPQHTGGSCIHCVSAPSRLLAEMRHAGAVWWVSNMAPG